MLLAALWALALTAQASPSPQAILNRILSANQISAQAVNRIDIQNSPALNAYTNGQTIVLSSALWEGLPQEDEKAFVIAHEAAHIVLQHIQKTQLRRTGLGLFDRFIIGRYISPNSQLVNLGLTLIDRRFSRDVEYQADDLGFKLLRQAGYDPRAALRVFEFLGQNSGRQNMPEFLSTHPISESRMRRLVSLYRL